MAIVVMATVAVIGFGDINLARADRPTPTREDSSVKREPPVSVTNGKPKKAKTGKELKLPLGQHFAYTVVDTPEGKALLTLSDDVEDSVSTDGLRRGDNPIPEVQHQDLRRRGRSCQWVEYETYLYLLVQLFDCRQAVDSRRLNFGVLAVLVERYPTLEHVLELEGSFRRWTSGAPWRCFWGRLLLDLPLVDPSGRLGQLLLRLVQIGDGDAETCGDSAVFDRRRNSHLCRGSDRVH